MVLRGLFGGQPDPDQARRSRPRRRPRSPWSETRSPSAASPAELEALPIEQRRFVAGFAYVLARVAHADLDVSDAELGYMEAGHRRASGGLSEAQAVLVVEMARNMNELYGATDDYVVTREFATRATPGAARERCCARPSRVGAADDSISARGGRRAQRDRQGAGLPVRGGRRHPRRVPRPAGGHPGHARRPGALSSAAPARDRRRPAPDRRPGAPVASLGSDGDRARPDRRSAWPWAAQRPRPAPSPAPGALPRVARDARAQVAPASPSRTAARSASTTSAIPTARRSSSSTASARRAWCAIRTTTSPPQLGARIIAVDRPGIGISTRRPTVA